MNQIKDKMPALALCLCLLCAFAAAANGNIRYDEHYQFAAMLVGIVAFAGLMLRNRTDP